MADEQEAQDLRDGESDGASGLPADSDPTRIPDGVPDAEAALDSVQEAVGAVKSATVGRDEESAVDLPDFGTDTASAPTPGGMSLLDDVSLRVKVELGRTMMFVEDVLRLTTDSVIELDKAAGDPVDIYVNNRHVARGEVLVLNENFCVRVSEIINTGSGDEDENP